MEEKSSPFSDSEAVLATVARLFAAEGDLLAVDVLASAKADFHWYSHDNWDGGFDIYQLYLKVSLALFSKIGERKQLLEQGILEKVQAVSQGHTSDHVQSVSIILEITGGKDWRKKAQAWVSGDEGTVQTHR